MANDVRTHRVSGLDESRLVSRPALRTQGNASHVYLEDQLLMRRYVCFFGAAGGVAPSVLFFPGFRVSLALSLTLTGCMTMTDKTGAKSYSILGAYKPPNGEGFGVCVWPFAFWVLLGRKSHGN